MPLSFHDAFIYEDSGSLLWFQREGIYQSDLWVWKFDALWSGDYCYLESLLRNIKVNFSDAKELNTWIDEILLGMSSEGYAFYFDGLGELLKICTKIDKWLLYISIQQTAKELFWNDFDRLRIIFNWNWFDFDFFGYYRWVRSGDILSRSLALLKKPNPEDAVKTVTDWVIEDIQRIRNTIYQHRWITAINEAWVITDDSISVVSSVITWLVHINIPDSKEASDEIQF